MAPPTPGEVKETRVVTKRKPKAISRPTLPVKPVKFTPREQYEKFQIIYKFLTDGIDSEDIMYLKRSYEMVLPESSNLVHRLNIHF